jgi:hypothetical protein
MRQEVIELGRLGPWPPSDVVVREKLDSLIDKYGQLIKSIRKPVTNEEARVLVTVFGPDEGFGLVWPLIALVESAPDWPLADCLESADKEWIQVLKQRVRNAARQ